MQNQITTAVAAISSLSLDAIEARLDELEQERFLLLAVQSFRKALEGECEKRGVEALPSTQPKDNTPEHPWRGRPFEYKLFHVLTAVEDQGMSKLQSVAEMLDVSYQTILGFANERPHFFHKQGHCWSLSEEGRIKLDELKAIQQKDLSHASKP